MQTSMPSNITLADGVGHTFFARDPVPGEEAPQRSDAGAHATLCQHLAQLRQRRIGLLLDRARMKAAWSSILGVRRSPPCGLAAGVP